MDTTDHGVLHVHGGVAQGEELVNICSRYPFLLPLHGQQCISVLTWTSGLVTCPEAC